MATKKEKDKNTVQCISCRKEISIDHIGIKCVQSHNICPDCVPEFLNVVFNEPHHYLPPKCFECHTDIPLVVFERQLNRTQLELYLLFVYKTFISTDELSQGCPFCNYFEIWPKKNEMNFFYCKSVECKKMSCTICHKNICNIEEGYEKEEDKYGEIDSDISGHFECMEFALPLKKFEIALENGEKMFCPVCKIGGRKDASCTHMLCPGCQTTWCYMCGKEEKNCDKADAKGGISSHNTDWEVNVLRCPMYFNQISEVDESWPEDDEPCLARFHKRRTLELLKECVKEIGVPTYKKLVLKFHSVSACGFSLDDILNYETTHLFKRLI